MVDFLFNPSNVFASNAGSSLRKRRRDRVPESFIHANVIIVAVFVFSWGWGTLAFWPTRFLFLADFTLSDVVLTETKKTGLVSKLRALRAPLYTRARNWAVLTFAKTSGIVIGDREKNWSVTNFAVTGQLGCKTSWRNVFWRTQTQDGKFLLLGLSEFNPGKIQSYLKSWTGQNSCESTSL